MIYDCIMTETSNNQNSALNFNENIAKSMLDDELPDNLHKVIK